MCFKYSSGGINQCTYGDAYNANIVSHEMGHNFDMQHDGSGNDCDNSYIMASTASPYGYNPDEFSECSIEYTQDFFEDYSSTLSCLDNEPFETEYAVCGNGFVEQGESCDCGSSDCSGSDSCCDGATCSIYGDFECSNSDACCEDCQVVSAGSTCRAQDTDNDCDIGPETCDGVSSECPTDTFYVEGTPCTFDTNEDGMCYGGECISIPHQCQDYQDFYQAGTSTYETCTADISLGYKTNNCDNQVQCSQDGGSCGDVDSNVYWDDGTPCNEGANSCDTEQCQCYDGDCSRSNTLFTYVWSAGAWSSCSKDCKDDENEDPGFQTRNVNCTLQNGTIVDNTNCEDDKPQSSRNCNDFICSFCTGFSDGDNGLCSDNSECNEERGICECDNGYSGTFCTIEPGLNWIGVTRRVFSNDSITISYRADPCMIFNGTEFDGVALTIPIVQNALTDMYVGESIYMRWNSSGDLDELAVGLESLDSHNDNRWPIYAGDELATDNQDCDNPFLDDGNGTLINNTQYDNECYEDLACDDFGFEITIDEVPPGNYSIIVKFNNDFVVYSEPLTIRCSDAYCNSAGHGQCTDEWGTCECDDGWYGIACTLNNCTDWEFREWNADAYAASEFIPRCYEGTCNEFASSIDDLCDCGIHYTGTYCEEPIDGCGGLSMTDCQTEAGTTGICEWDGSRCIYSECSSYIETQCGTTNSTIGICEWDSTNGYCSKITCDENDPLPACENGAVRRQLNSDESICSSWYCDCSTVIYEDHYWTVSPVSTLSSLDPDNAEDLPLFTCSECSLECDHGSKENDECTDCRSCDEDVYGGVECNKVQWIGNFRVKVLWADAAGYDEVEFDELLVTDLAYLLDVDTSKIEIWQLKEDDEKQNTTVYFKYIFDTESDLTAQQTGGDIFNNLKEEIETPGSDAYRGFIMGRTDSTYSLDFCIPAKEECDPDAQFNFQFWFFICFGCSFGFELILVLIYRLGTRSRRQKKYEEKVKEVRKAQLQLMEHHQKARRVGMRDVSRSRAAKVHKQKEKIHKQEVAEARRRSQIERDEVRRSRGSSAAQSSHNQNQSEMEMNGGRFLQSRSISQNQQQQQQQDVPSRSSVAQHDVGGGEGGGAGEGGFGAGDFERPLPPGWVMYLSADGIPYYYNTTTGATTWRHPSDPQF